VPIKIDLATLIKSIILNTLPIIDIIGNVSIYLNFRLAGGDIPGLVSDISD
jgi:hypothetical protein